MAERVRIAVIDSGVYPVHPHIVAARILPGVAIAADGTIAYGPEKATDQLGHGTAVTAAIQELAPDADVLPIRVFQGALRASARALVTAIVWAAEQRADVINCSLGTPNATHAALFDDAVARIGAARLVAPLVGGDDAPCWPGQCAGVVAVGLDWDMPRGVARLDGGVWYAAGYPRPIPGVEQLRNLHGVSFATAQISGLIAAGRLD
ncbi:S8 family serine peptidase [Novosphingobium sp.]|uniref:S8 family serine peptidase n=1 Tax=Novosphingobium sp. TaxID=1874826 RepID=UPI00333F86EF